MRRTRSFWGANQVPWGANYNGANSLRGETTGFQDTVFYYFIWFVLFCFPIQDPSSEVSLCLWPILQKKSNQQRYILSFLFCLIFFFHLLLLVFAQKLLIYIHGYMLPKFWPSPQVTKRDIWINETILPSRDATLLYYPLLYYQTRKTKKISGMLLCSIKKANRA